MDSRRNEFTFFWFIENYSYCRHENREVLISPPFTAGWLEGTAWTLELCPRGIYPSTKGYVSLFLRRSASDDGPENVSIKRELSALAADGSPLHSDEYGRMFKKGSGCGLAEFLDMDEILLRRKADYLPQDILTVRCKIWKGEGNVHNIGQCTARTRIGVEKISFLHGVENFSMLEPNQKNTIRFRSHSRNEGFVSSTSSLYFTHDSCRGGEMIVEIASDGSHVLCKRKISVLDGSGNIIGLDVDDNQSDITRKDISKLPLSLTREVLLNKKSEYLPNGKLALLCECVFSTGLILEYIEETQHEIPMAIAKRANYQELGEKYVNTKEKASAYPSISEDMKVLYINKSLTDADLKTKTKSFPVHKIVLCARSPVFRRMLTSDMKERNTDCIQVDDLGDDVVQQLLLFLYSDTVENLQWEMAIQLYYAADKYQVGKLKRVCSSFLIENLTPTNAGELLLWADTHSDSDLKESVEDFILEHEEVFVSKEWEMLMETNSQLAGKTMQLKFKRRKLE